MISNAKIRDLNGLNSGNVLCIAEPLETRRLLAVGPQCVPAFGGHDLYVIGTDNDDTIDVRLNGNVVEGNLNGQNYVSCTNLGVIRIYGEDGADAITVQPGVTHRAFIWGGDKGDNIHGGSGDDIIMGEGGNDVIGGNFGNDFLDGGADNDNLNGGYQNDSLTGGSGQDYMAGEQGDDYFEYNADGEVDEIHGGSGDGDYDVMNGYDTTNPADIFSGIESMLG